MSRLPRRTFAKLSLAGLLSGCQQATFGTVSIAKTKAQVVVVGGGYAGATAARAVKRFDPSLEVVLITPETVYATGPFTNMVLGGFVPPTFIERSFADLSKAGVKVVTDRALRLDPTARLIRTAKSGTFAFERLILAPGVDFKFDQISGYDESDIKRLPHAFREREQTALLRAQLEAMPDGGVFMLRVPESPSRAPLAPYERASLIASYFRAYKPASKIILLDPKESFPLQPLFEEGWAKNFPGMITHLKGKAGQVTAANVRGKELRTKDGTKHKADVINLIPDQWASSIARAADLTGDGDWCAVNPLTWESTVHPNIHVIGDAAHTEPMTKTATAAHGQALACAAAVTALLRGQKPEAVPLVEASFALISPTYGISQVAVSTLKNGALHAVKNAGGISPTGANAVFRLGEAKQARSSYQNLCADIWG